MYKFPTADSITARDFELLVRGWLEVGAGGLTAFSASHLKTLAGPDGDYTFDVTAQFKAFGGASMTVIVECKRYVHPIKRELVQILNDKKRSVGAHKAILVATASFQSGAIEYAEKNGVALVQIVSGSAVYIKASVARGKSAPSSTKDRSVSNDASADVPDPLVGLFYGQNQKRRLIYPQLLSSRMGQEMERFLHG